MPRKRERDFRLGGGGERRGDARHDLEGDAGLAQRRHLLAGAAEDERVAGLQPHDAAACRGLAHQQRVDLVLRGGMAPLRLPTSMRSRVAAAHGDDCLGHEPVVHDHVGFLQDALGAQREQVRRAGPGADQPHEALVGGIGLGEQARGEAARFVGTARQRGIGDAAFEEGRPEAPARLAFRQNAIGGGAEGIAELRQQAQLRRKHRLDAGAQFLRKHRAGAGGGDRHGDRGAVDDGRRVEIAEFRDDRRRSPGCSSPARPLRPRRRVRARRWRRRRAPLRRDRRPGRDGRDAPPREGSPAEPDRRSGAAETRRISRIGFAEQPQLRGGLRTVADDEHDASGDLVEGGKHRKPFSRHRTKRPEETFGQYGVSASGETAMDLRRFGRGERNFSVARHLRPCFRFGLPGSGTAPAISEVLPVSYTASTGFPALPRLSTPGHRWLSIGGLKRKGVRIVARKADDGLPSCAAGATARNGRGATLRG